MGVSKVGKSFSMIIVCPCMDGGRFFQLPGVIHCNHTINFGLNAINVKLSYFLKQVEPFLVEVKIPHEIIENVASTFHA